MNDSERAANEHYGWPDGKKWAFAISADVDGESPFLWRSRALQIRNIAEREQRRFGPTTGVFRLAALFSELRVPATFFVPGYIAETYPDIVPALVGQDFEVGLHGYLHELPDEISSDELRSATMRSIEILSKQSGAARFGHRSPGWRVTDEQIDLLMELKVLYDSSLMRQETPYRYRGLNQIPIYWFWDDSPFLRYTGPDRDSWRPPLLSDMEQVWKDECEGIRYSGGVFVLTIHPWNSGRGSRLLLLKRLLTWILRQEDVWIADLRQISDHHNRKAISPETAGKGVR